MDNFTHNIDIILSYEPHKYIISNPIKKEEKFSRMIINLKNEFYHVEQFSKDKVYHENIPKKDIKTFITGIMENNYKQLNAWNEDYELMIRISKKGKCLFSKVRNKNIQPLAMDHNRRKNYILPEGTLIQPLVDMGIFTQSGTVVKAMYDKYKQINRFIEIIDDAIKDLDIDDFTIIDFGCGKSYFTFVLYYYFRVIRKINVTIIGLDLKVDVIAKCNETAEKYGYEQLHFELGDINGYQCNFPVDMVITLHACDTATDYALFNAIEWEAKMIFSVPCCQHELNGQIESDKLSLLTHYGIIKERTAALMTDAIRGHLLEYCGYKTQLLEFIDFDHTPKNILIRGIKKNIPVAVKNKRLEEVRNIIREFGLNPTLYQLLQENKYFD
ncbi:class I SAM-dependent methyltransferase [Acetobacterium bakii]|uniref:Methyltransferase n=1 Tax=Acetobacterium bakii TaxID=52689 RepID=A0A0L6TX10_9FIRM|nr:SAM-dependent methyltransferase [Acetobacterium bakii]KNZ40788.1 methyltransferase [Acetobacterium bakii]